MLPKSLKSLYINDHAITNIWRAPPKIPIDPNFSEANESFLKDGLHKNEQ